MQVMFVNDVWTQLVRLVAGGQAAQKQARLPWNAIKCQGEGERPRGCWLEDTGSSREKREGQTSHE